MPFEYENEAKRNEPMPTGLTSSQQMCYQAMALMTMRYKLGELNAEQAIAEKRQIEREYTEMSAREQYITHCSDLWANIETAAIEYNKTRTLEAADKMREVIYGSAGYAESKI